MHAKTQPQLLPYLTRAILVQLLLCLPCGFAVFQAAPLDQVLCCCTATWNVVLQHALHLQMSMREGAQSRGVRWVGKARGAAVCDTTATALAVTKALDSNGTAWHKGCEERGGKTGGSEAARQVEDRWVGRSKHMAVGLEQHSGSAVAPAGVTNMSQHMCYTQLWLVTCSHLGSMPPLLLLLLGSSAARDIKLRSSTAPRLPSRAVPGSHTAARYDLPAVVRADRETE
jgi:hypothetical protein